MKHFLGLHVLNSGYRYQSFRNFSDRRIATEMTPFMYETGQDTAAVFLDVLT